MHTSWQNLNDGDFVLQKLPLKCHVEQGQEQSTNSNKAASDAFLTGYGLNILFRENKSESKSKHKKKKKKEIYIFCLQNRYIKSTDSPIKISQIRSTHTRQPRLFLPPSPLSLPFFFLFLFDFLIFLGSVWIRSETIDFKIWLRVSNFSISLSSWHLISDFVFGLFDFDNFGQLFCKKIKEIED